MKNTLHIKRIDHVLEALNYMIDDAEKNNDTGGYFAALYCKVTVQVKEGIRNNIFDDGDRMEALDVLFAKRYINAWIARKHGNAITRSWKVAFDVSAHFRPVVLQHLLLGMNAHINLDLGIAAAQIMQGERLAALHRDFNKINTVLSSMVQEVQNDLAIIWPTLAKILRTTGKADDFLIDFSMKLARDGAWKFANEMAEEKSDQIKSLIVARDKRIAQKAQLILRPGLLPSLLFLIIRLGERGTVSDKIRAIR